MHRDAPPSEDHTGHGDHRAARSGTDLTGPRGIPDVRFTLTARPAEVTPDPGAPGHSGAGAAGRRGGGCEGAVSEGA